MGVAIESRVHRPDLALPVTEHQMVQAMEALPTAIIVRLCVSLRPLNRAHSAVHHHDGHQQYGAKKRLHGFSAGILNFEGIPPRAFTMQN